MAVGEKRGSELPTTTTPIDDDDLVILVIDGTTYAVPPGLLREYVNPLWDVDVVTASELEGSVGALALLNTVADAKGDLPVASAADIWVRLAAGATGQILRVNPAAPAGIEWSDEQSPGVGIPITLADAKGDLPVATGNDTWVRLPVGNPGQVLTLDPAQVVGMKWADPSGGGGGTGSGSSLTIEDVAATSYTFTTADVGKLKRSTSASATVFTVPSNATVAIPINDWVEVGEWGAGQLSIAWSAPVVVRALGSPASPAALAAQYAGARLHKVATDEWWMQGTLA